MPPEGLIPPYAEPSRPLLDDDALIRGYVRGDRTGHSEQFHIEGDTLMVARGLPLALRLDRDSLLLRIDLPERLLPARSLLQEVMGEEGMSLLDADTMLAAAVAIQVLGLRLSTWDLWGSDIERAFAALRAAAAGDESDFFTPGGGGGPLA